MSHYTDFSVIFLINGFFESHHFIHYLKSTWSRYSLFFVYEDHGGFIVTMLHPLLRCSTSDMTNESNKNKEIKLLNEYGKKEWK